MEDVALINPEQLKSVFDLCDEKQEGFISTDRFSGLAKEHFGGAEEVSCVACRWHR